MPSFSLLVISRFLLMVTAIALFLGGQGLPAGAVTFTPTPPQKITSNYQPDNYPKVNVNGYITWAGFDGHDREIFLYDPVRKKTVQVTNNMYDDESPRINKKNQIVWRAQRDHDDASYDIYLYSYNPYGNTDPYVGYSSFTSWIGRYTSCSVPEINDKGMLVWEATTRGNPDKDIYYYHLGSVRKISVPVGDDCAPKISNKNEVVWQVWDGTDYEIALRLSNGSFRQVTNNDYNDTNPQINDNGQIAWEGEVGKGDKEIFLYQISPNTTAQLTDNQVWDNDVRLNNRGNVAWRQEGPPDDEVWLFARGLAAPITNNDRDDGLIGFDDNNQVFIGSRSTVGNVGQAFVWSNGVISQMTTSSYLKYDGSVSSDGRIVWSESDGTDLEIWTRTATADPLYSYDFTYTYSNGDKYSGNVFAAKAKGYTVNKTWQVSDENGSLGTYKIIGETAVTSGVAGKVHLNANSYYDAETKNYYTIMDSTRALGSNYLGSEAGYIIQNNVASYYFGRGYYEADTPAKATDYTRFNFTYFYGSGDSYTGRVFAPANNGTNDGLYVGKVLRNIANTSQPLIDENFLQKSTGYYLITDMGPNSTSFYGKVYVDNYYDSETKTNNAPIHKGTAIGTKYLGSEADYIIADKNPLYYFGPGSYWLNPDRRNFAYNWVVYEADKTPGFATVGTNINPSYDNYEPIANEKGQMVWYGWDGTDFEIYYYGIDEGPKQLTNNSTNDLYPHINNKGQIAWTGWEGNDWDVFLYDPATKLTKQLSTSPNDDGLHVWGSEGQDYAYGPLINEAGQVVWAGWDGHDQEIYRWTAGTIKQITNNAIDDTLPRINAKGWVAWQGWTNQYSGLNPGLYNWDIYLYDNVSIKNVSIKNTNFDGRHQLNDNGALVWNWNDGTDIEVAYWKAGVLKMVTNNNVVDTYRRLNNKDHILYAGYDGNDFELYLWTGASPAKQITNNTTDDIYPRFNNADEIVWQSYDTSGVTDNRNPDWEIYHYAAGKTTKLTDNEYDDVVPRITDGGVIVWTGSKYGETFQVNMAGKENYYEYSYTFSYSNGDKYYGTVRTTANKYYVGQKISAPVAIEGALTGSYVITGMSAYSVPALSGQVKAAAYWNAENKAIYTPFSSSNILTTLGLGKETAFIIKYGVTQYRFGLYNSLFYEADL